MHENPEAFVLIFRVEHQGWRRVPSLRAKLVKAAAATFAQLPKSLRVRGTINVLLTKDAVLKKLNRDFRGIDKATNVLSFPQFAHKELTKRPRPKGEAIYLGDIAIGYQYIVGEAKKDNKILINHVTHLLIHGILHILGYDHMNDAEANKMERLEKKVMAGLGLADPYAPQPREPKAR